MLHDRKALCFIGLLLIILYPSYGVKAQAFTEDSLVLEIKESTVNVQVISHILKIANLSEKVFQGTVLLDPLSDLHPLSREEQELSVVPGDSAFIAYRLVVGRDLGAGRKTIRYLILDGKKESVLARETYIDIEEREQIYLSVSDAPLMVPQDGDSVRIDVTVNNSGNTS